LSAAVWARSLLEQRDVGPFGLQLWAVDVLVHGRSVPAKRLDRIKQLNSPTDATIGHRTTVFTRQSIAARTRFLTAQVDQLNPELATLVN
jgi:hypothetical protein